MLYEYFYVTIQVIMKNSLLIPVVFIVNFILWLAAFSIFAGLWQYLMFGNGNYNFLLYAALHKMYLFLPLACVCAVFSVYVFLMRHRSKNWLSFLIFVFIFGIFFAGIIPAIYSQAHKIDFVFNSQKQELTKDEYLIEFIELPLFLQETHEIVIPLMQDIFLQYTKSYINYLIFAGSFFLLVTSFWVCTICSDWKILNFSLLPFFSYLLFYGYSYAKINDFEKLVLQNIPLRLPQGSVFPICFTLIAFLFYMYTGFLLFIRYIIKNPRPQYPKKKNPKKIKSFKPKKNSKQGQGFFNKNRQAAHV